MLLYLRSSFVFSSRFVRVITVTYVLIMATVVTPDDFFKNIIDNDDSIKVNENFIATKINKGLVEQRGNFTKTNLQRYLETFYEKESERKIDFPTHLRKNFKPFNIVVLQVNSMSNKDLYVHNAKEHAVLKRFDIYLSDLILQLQTKMRLLYVYLMLYAVRNLVMSS